jgi:hypothetical protein
MVGEEAAVFEKAVEFVGSRISEQVEEIREVSGKRSK